VNGRPSRCGSSSEWQSSLIAITLLFLARRAPAPTWLGLLGTTTVLALTEAAAKLGIAIIAPDLNGPDDIAGAIQVLASERVDAAIVLETSMLLSVRDQIAKLMSENLVPAMYGYREHVQAGGLISYGVDLVWCWQRAATFAQKILNGTAPADLPVEFPTKMQMAVNLKPRRPSASPFPRPCSPALTR
jgi:putative tryptophan/tyrosine transport system substrate-binding protein